MHAFLDRPLPGGRPCSWLDAACLKQREGGRTVLAAARAAAAVDGEGKRETVGLRADFAEARTKA